VCHQTFSSMFKFIFISLLCVSLARMSNDTIVNFAKFMEKYHKSYDSFREYGRRLKIFSDNMDKLEFICGLHVQPSGQDVFGVTPFSDLTEQEFAKSYLGHFSSENNPPELNQSKSDFFKMNPVVKLNIRSLVSRRYWPQTPIKNQGYCASSAEMCVTEQIESFTKLKFSSWNFQPLSVQQIIDCNPYCTPCAGCSSDACYYYAKLFGLESEASYPFVYPRDRSEGCQYHTDKRVVSTGNWYDFEFVFNKHFALLYILSELGPFSAYVNSDYWQFYTGGVLGYLQQPEGVNLCVQFVGYDENLNYWIVRNAWGSSWGEDGYIRISMNSNFENNILNVQIPAPQSIRLV